MFNKKNMKNIIFFVILPPDLKLRASHKHQIVI